MLSKVYFFLNVAKTTNGRKEFSDDPLLYHAGQDILSL